MMDDWDSWSIFLRQQVLRTKIPLTSEAINERTKLLRGTYIPFEKFQCETLEIMLNKIPGVVVFKNDDKYYVLAAPTNEEKHFADAPQITSIEKKLNVIYDRYSQIKSNANKIKPNVKLVTPKANENEKPQIESHVAHTCIATKNSSNFISDNSTHGTKQMYYNPPVQVRNTQRKFVNLNRSVPHSNFTYKNCNQFSSNGKNQRSVQNRLQEYKSTPEPTHGPNHRCANFTTRVLSQHQNLNKNLDESVLAMPLQQKNVNVNQNALLQGGKVNFSPAQPVSLMQEYNWTADDPRLYLYCYTQTKNVPRPEYKHLHTLDNIYAVVVVDSNTYSSFPHIALSKEEAEKYAASCALEILLGKKTINTNIFAHSQKVINLEAYDVHYITNTQSGHKPH
ncbi:uncharacterized protein LOC106644851 [Copidosoma floridanum]|uniref:uncharacterized protein LOC106644851 n=1 Tax=Copidosoma floridanum TaxID=29053 RepID=UPI0006C968BB|nr:uncharacterized protein LOC106644851 [Copidosoma floridanum]